MRNRRTVFLSILVIIFLLAVANGMGNNSEENKIKQKQEKLFEYIDRNMSEEVYRCLSTNTDMRVWLSENGVTASVRVVLPQNIPFVAEELCILFSNAASELEIEISKLSVQAYSQNSAGEIWSMIDWHTYDLRVGIFTHEDDGILVGGYTVRDLYRYFDVEEGSFIG